MNRDKLKGAILRTFGKPMIDLPSEENYLCDLGFLREGTLGYEVSEEDWAILNPLLYARREETITFAPGRTFFRRGAVLLVSHVIFGGKNFIIVEDGRKDKPEYVLQYLLEIVDSMGMGEERTCRE